MACLAKVKGQEVAVECGFSRHGDLEYSQNYA